MAHDTFQLNIMLDVDGPEYAIVTGNEWNEHYHGNEKMKAAVVAAVKELLENTLSVVMVDGTEMSISGITVQLDAVEINTTPDEQRALDAAAAAEDKAWDCFQDEVRRRMDAEDTDLFEAGPGVYSMGDLGGPISQLDEIAHAGTAQVVITDGWGNHEDVFSTSVIHNPTNWDMFRMFCQAMAESNDRDHVFLEGVQYSYTDDDGVATYEAITGS